LAFFFLQVDAAEGNVQQDSSPPAEPVPAKRQCFSCDFTQSQPKSEPCLWL